MTIALFDFDGTITRGDSFARFLRFVLGWGFYFKIAQNLHVLILYKLGLLSNEVAKKHILKATLGGMKSEDIKKKCYEFTHSLESFCKDSALEKIRWHKSQGHRVVLVSASFEEYLKPLCEKWDIEVLATCMEVKEGIITGNFVGKNCYGEEKVRRIKDRYCLKNIGDSKSCGKRDAEKMAFSAKDASKKNFDEPIHKEIYENIYVYGDTKGDFEMLKLASHSKGFYRVFK